MLFLQLSLWINEKMLTAQDMSYDEARNLHSKWLKHQAFMAELQSNKEWLDKIDKVGGGRCCVVTTVCQTHCEEAFRALKTNLSSPSGWADADGREARDGGHG